MSVPAGATHGTDAVELRVPAEPASLATVRLFSASVGTAFGVSADVTEDLKLVLSELCAGSVGVSDTFRVTVASISGQLRVECRGTAWASGPDADRRKGILEALLPDVDYSADVVSFALDL